MTTTKTRTRQSEPDSRILIVEPATEGGVRNVDYPKFGEGSDG